MSWFERNQWIQSILENVAAREDIEDKIHLLNNPEFMEEFFQLFFSGRPTNNSVSFISFKTQILNYLTSEEALTYKALKAHNSDMVDHKLQMFIRCEIESKKINGGFGSVQDTALSRLHKLISIHLANPRLKYTYSTRTTNGWYGIPTFDESVPNSITQVAKNTLND